MLSHEKNSQNNKSTIDLTISNNIQKISKNINSTDNTIDEKNKIPENSPAFIFCNSLKELNSPNENGWTPIYRSIIANNYSALIELLKLGGNPNITNNLGETPLYLCIENENFNSLIKLLEFGADPNIQKKNGTTPLHLAIKKKLEKKYVVELLKKGADPNILNKLYNQTPTHLALINKYDEDVLKIFKEKKGEIYEIKDKYDKTPFDYVKELNDKDYINKVVEIFGKEKVKENKKDKKLDGIKLVEINLDDHINIDIGENNNDNIFPLSKNNDDIINKYDFKKEINLSEKKNDILLNNNIDDITNKINNLKSMINNHKEIIFKENIINIEKELNLNNNLITHTTKKIPPLLNNHENSYLLNSLDNLDKINKKNTKSETKDIILLPDYLKIEKNSIKTEKPEKSDILTNNLKNQININIENIANNKNLSNNIEKRSEKNTNTNLNLLSSNKNIYSESICYSLSKDISEIKNQIQIQNQSHIKKENEKEKENDIEINNKIFSNSSSTDKEIIKTIISATSKKLKNSKISNSSKNSLNLNDENEILSILDNNDNNEDKKNKTSSFIINSKNKEEKINENENKEDSNIFSELQMNSTNSNFNKTKIEEDNFKDTFKDNGKISKINTNNTNTTNIYTNIDKNNSLQNKGTVFISNYNKENENKENIKDINKQNTKSEKSDINNIDDINIYVSNLNKDIIDNKEDEISKNKNIKNNNNNNNKKNIKKISYYNKINKEKENKEKLTLNNEEENLTDITNKIVNMLKEERNTIKKGNKNNLNSNENKENENPNIKKIKKTQIYKNKNYLAKSKNIKSNKNINRDYSLNKINKKKENLIYKNYNKYNNYISKARSINKNNILYNKQKIFRHSSPDYNINNHYMSKEKNKENLITENSYRNNTSFISILNTNSNSNNKSNNNIIIYRNKNIFNRKKLIYEGNTLNNTTYSSFNMNNTSSRNYYKPFMNTNSIKTNSFANSNCNFSYRNSNDQQVLTNTYNNINTNNFQMSFIKPHRAISNTLLIRLRDWLISCDLLCYYNILIKNNMYNIDRYIEDIRYNKINISFKDVEDLGIKKPGHIFRLLLKLEVDSGKIDNNLYNYLIEKFNINTITNNGVLTSSISDIKCCGLNCCSTNNHHNTRKMLINNNIYNDNNYYNYDENKTNETENDCGENEINYVDIFSFLKRKNLWRYKENFIHNGFDQIEYILIQLFSKYTFDKNLLNDYMHIYLDEDKNIVLKVLYKEKKKLCSLLGLPYNNEQLKQILISQTSSIDYHNNYINSVTQTNPNNHNNDTCCIIY